MGLKKTVYGLIVFILIMMLCGCDNNAKNTSNDIDFSKGVAEHNYEKKTMENNELIENNKQEVDNKNINVSKDEIILNYFNEVKHSIDEFLKSEKIENIKEACKNYFVTFVDFIFYGGQIKGVTFNELTNETKIKVINLTRKIDELIMTKFPDYKETISVESKKLFESVCNLLDEGKDGVENFIIEKIGEEKYSDILDSFNTFMIQVNRK